MGLKDHFHHSVERILPLNVYRKMIETDTLIRGYQIAQEEECTRGNKIFNLKEKTCYNLTKSFLFTFMSYEMNIHCVQCKWLKTCAMLIKIKYVSKIS